MENESTIPHNLRISEALDILYTETEDFLHVPFEIPEIDIDVTYSPDWVFNFYKNYVSKNKPLLIRNGSKHFPAFNKWNKEYFREILSDKEVTVAITPNGYADGIAMSPNQKDKKEYFVLPEERNMMFNEFLEHLDEPVDNVVCYIQKQNSNLNEFTELLEDIGKGFDWAFKAFGAEADNINFWMGDKRAITSMHKDPYENIYCVIDGYKDFLIIPPTDLPYVPYKEYPVATYENVTSTHYTFKEKNENQPINFVKWIPVDPLDPKSIELYPEFKKARKYNIRVNKGDVLYLPSLWFHHVRQSHGCIAVNFWNYAKIKNFIFELFSFYLLK